ncbi:hypothetical protein Tco_0689387 [Tanacetum coccineum]
MLWEWRGIANMDFIQLGGSSRVGEMILARERSGFAGEKVWDDHQVVPGKGSSQKYCCTVFEEFPFLARVDIPLITEIYRAMRILSLYLLWDRAHARKDSLIVIPDDLAARFEASFRVNYIKSQTIEGQNHRSNLALESSLCKELLEGEGLKLLPSTLPKVLHQGVNRLHRTLVQMVHSSSGCNQDWRLG